MKRLRRLRIGSSRCTMLCCVFRYDEISMNKDDSRYLVVVLKRNEDEVKA